MYNESKIINKDVVINTGSKRRFPAEDNDDDDDDDADDHGKPAKRARKGNDRHKKKIEYNIVKI